MTVSSRYRYFDYAASNPMLPEAVSAMVSALGEVGNPSSLHQCGLTARQRLDDSRRLLADWLAVRPVEITFTSGATEANNLAIYGLLQPWLHALPAADSAAAGSVQPVRAGNNLIVSSLEHSSVLRPAERLAEEFGGELRWVRPEADARLSAEAVGRQLDAETVLVAVTLANNVLGSVQPVAAVASLVAAERSRRAAAGEPRPIYLVCDAVQAANWLPLQPKALGVDVLVLSGHKCGGPKGIGLLWQRPDLVLRPLVLGGGQEADLRSGTENLAAAIGWAAAVQRIMAEREAQAKRCVQLRAELWNRLHGQDGRWQVLGAPAEHSLPGTVYLARPGIAADAAVVQLDVAGFGVSAGSACDAGQRRAPGVVRELYPRLAGTGGGLRISFGYQTEAADIAALAVALSRLP